MGQKNKWHSFQVETFFDRMQFMNCSLDKLVKNLVNKDFKYLVKECGTENLKI